MLHRIKYGRSLVLLVSILLYGVSCQDEQHVRVEKMFYPDGKLQVAATLRGQQLHGPVTWYFPSGSIESRAEWVRGKRMGVTRFYYPNGRLKDSSHFVNDSLHGRVIRYYRNGTLKEVAHYTNGQPSGYTVLFDSTGRRTERHLYDKQGRLIAVRAHDPDGKPWGSMLMPLLVTKDTITLGENYQGFIYFGFPLTRKATLLVGRLGLNKKALDRYPLLDTILKVTQSPDGRFYFSYRPTQVGVNTFSYKFHQPHSPWDAMLENDSLSINDMSSTHRFLVRKPQQQ
jgi:hypothetical protein